MHRPEHRGANLKEKEDPPDEPERCHYKDPQHEDLRDAGEEDIACQHDHAFGPALVLILDKPEATDRP